MIHVIGAKSSACLAQMSVVQGNPLFRRTRYSIIYEYVNGRKESASAVAEQIPDSGCTAVVRSTKDKQLSSDIHNYQMSATRARTW